MDTEQIATIVQAAATKAVTDYLKMCGLDSPWEVPETFLVTESAKALAEKGADSGLRVAVEYGIDGVGKHPTAEEFDAIPARLQRPYAKLDLAILKSNNDEDCWKYSLDGIVEFKKHNWLNNDAALIAHMVARKGVTHGIIVSLFVGKSEKRVLTEEEKYISALPVDALSQGLPLCWKKLPRSQGAHEYPPARNSNILDRYWTITCLTLARK